MLGGMACAAWLVAGGIGGSTLAARTATGGTRVKAAAAEAKTPALPEIRYRYNAGQSVKRIAERYGLTLEDVAKTNDGKIEFERGDLIRLRPKRFAPPQASRTIKSSERRSWADVAARYDVSVANLRAWNPRFRRRKNVPPKATLRIWLDSGVTRFVHDARRQPLPDFDVRDDALSIGLPNRGRIEKALQLPESNLYTIRFNRLAWGSSLTVRNVQRALAAFRRDSGFRGEIYIGAISQRSGRRLRPHRSHQSGRDIDIRMPAMPHVKGHKLDRNEVDWHALWVMVDAFVRTDEVQVIFLERKLFPRLRSAGYRMGATDEQMGKVMGTIRHAKGHTSHIHVRFNCSENSPKCDQVD